MLVLPVPVVVTALRRLAADASSGLGFGSAWLGRRQVLHGAMAVVLLLAATGVAAEEVDVISPGRPRLTRGPGTTPPGILQIESGAQYSRTSRAGDPAERRISVVVSGRTGLTDRLEFQVVGEPFVSLRGAQEADDHGDLEFLLRYRLLEADAARRLPALSILPFVRAPLADAPIGSERPDFGLVALAGVDLPWGLTVDLNAGVVAVGQARPDGFLVQGLVGAFLGQSFTERVRGFAETVYTTRGERGGRAALRLNTGIVWAVTRDVALDVAANTSLVGRAPDVEVRGGLSFRFGR